MNVESGREMYKMSGNLEEREKQKCREDVDEKCGKERKIERMGEKGREEIKRKKNIVR